MQYIVYCLKLLTKEWEKKSQSIKKKKKKRAHILKKITFILTIFNMDRMECKQENLTTLWCLALIQKD